MSWKHEQPWEESLAEHDLQSDPVEKEAPVPASDPSPPPRPFSFCIFNQPQDGEPIVPVPDVTRLQLGPRDERPFPTHDYFGNPVTSTQSGIFSRPGYIPPPPTYPCNETNMVMASENDGTEEINTNELGNSDLRLPENLLVSSASQERHASFGATVKQRRRPKGRKPSDRWEQPQIVWNAALRPIQPSRVSKAKGSAANKKRDLPTQQSRVSQEVSSNEVLPLASEAVANGRPRRSAQLGQSEAKVVSVAHEVPSQSRPKRNVASSAKPRTSPKPRDISTGRSARDASDKTRKRKIVKKGKT